MNVDYINIKIIDKFENDRTLQVEQTQIGASKLVYNGSDDKYQSIMASEFSFNLTVTDKTDGKFFHLYTGNEKRYYVLVEDQDENMIFEGYLLPDFYEEPYTNGVIFVNLVATDGIGLLKGNYLPYEYYEKETSVIKLIAECLKLTKLEKQIYFSPAIISAVTNYKWNEIAIDGNNFKDNSDSKIEYLGFFGLNTVYPARKNVYEILNLLVHDIGCTLYAQGNIWYLEGINRKHQVNQFTEVYNLSGFLVDEYNVEKDKKDLVFFSNPNISIKSPWKRVDFKWDIDENGDLVTNEDVQPKFDSSLAGNYTFDFWKSNGAIQSGNISKGLRFVYEIQTVFPGVEFGNMMEPYTLNVFRSYTPSGFYGISYGEDAVNLPNNYLSIKNRKYLKVSDEFIDRSFEIDIKLNGGDKFTTTIPALDNGAFRKCFKVRLLSNQAVIFDTFDTSSVGVFECDLQSGSSTYSSDMVAGDSYILTSPMVKAAITRDYILLPSNGFFDLRLHAPLSPVFSSPYFKGYSIDSISIKYTAQKELEYTAERNIDYTTVYELSTAFGDSVQDLSLKQFRFKRPIYSSVIPERDIVQLSQQIITGIFYIGISYQDYNALISNLDLFVVIYEGEEINMSDIGAAAFYVFAGALPGYFWVTVYPGFINHPSGIGSSISDFSILKIKEAPSYVLGYEVEDNEWREQWKRYGEDENIRFVKALPKMYHDVQSLPIVCVEGVLANIFFPRDIGVFLWKDIKEFIPSRIEIDFSNGKTNVFMIESTFQIVNDYVN